MKQQSNQRASMHLGNDLTPCATGSQPVRTKTARPCRKLLRWTVKLGLASMLLMEVANCRETVVAPNLVAGVRDGLVTSTSGIIQDFFNAFFNLNGENADASGNGSFSGI